MIRRFVKRPFISDKVVMNGRNGISTNNAIETLKNRAPIGGIGGSRMDKPIFTTGYDVPHKIVATIRAKYLPVRVNRNKNTSVPCS